MGKVVYSLGAGITSMVLVSNAALAGTPIVVAVPGPIAGAGLPIVVAALGYAAWRKHRANRDRTPRS